MTKEFKEALKGTKPFIIYEGCFPLYTAEQALAAHEAVSVILTKEQRVYLDQAQLELEDRALGQYEKGNDSIAKGCEASAYVIREMLAAPQPSVNAAVQPSGDEVVGYVAGHNITADEVKACTENLRQSAVQPAGDSELNIDEAARKLAELFDYPWEHMPAQGRESMRKNVRTVLDVAIPPAP